MIKIIELFAGIGSQRQALKDANIEHEVVAISEIDKYALQSYKAIHGDCPNLGSITDIKRLPKADLWTYSFPCQDISIAGDMKGIKKGTRSGLLYEVERLLKVAKENNELPKYLLLENVKNLVSKRFKPQFDEWLRFLADLGYSNYWQILNAKDYGIPQNRERVFCVSILGYEEYSFPPKQELKLKLKDMLEAEVDEKYYLSPKMIKYIIANNEKWTGNNEKSLVNKEIASTINTREGSRRCDASNYISNDLPENADLKQYGNRRLNETLENNEVQDEDFIDAYNRSVKSDIAGTISTRVPESNCTFVADSVPIKNATKQGFLLAEDGDGVDISGRMKYHRGTVQKEKSQTITCSGGNNVGVVVKEAYTDLEKQLFTEDGNIRRYIGSEIIDEFKEGQMATTSYPNGYGHGTRTHDESVSLTIGERPSVKTNLRIRKLTPRECFRLMGWSDEQIDKIQASGVSSAQQYKQAGNGIVVNCLTEIFKNIEGENQNV